MSGTSNRFFFAVVSLVLVALTGNGPGVRAGERWPSSELLQPCFEVGLTGGLTTVFAVVNGSENGTRIDLGVLTNWGIEVLTTSVPLDGHEVFQVDLAEWIVRGNLPDRTLSAEQLQHVQAALTGEPSPLDGLYYSSPDPLDPFIATGSVRIRRHTESAPWVKNVLWGDFIVVDRALRDASGGLLVNLDPRVRLKDPDDDGLCAIHAFRFIGGIGGESEFIVWAPLSAADPGACPDCAPHKIPASLRAYSNGGEYVAHLEREFLPLERVAVADLGLPVNFGWLRLDTGGVPSALTVRHRFMPGVGPTMSAERESFCLDWLVESEQPRIHLEKRINGADADHPPGVRVDSGGELTWEFEVSNWGGVPLSDVTLSDDFLDLADVVCPATTLAPGETMTCQIRGSADECLRANVGRVIATAPDGAPVTDQDAAYYTGENVAVLELQKHTNGEDADDAPGPEIAVGEPVEWTYTLTNRGEVEVTRIGVKDNLLGQVACPGTFLAPDESMVCTAGGTAAAGQYRNVGIATGETPCGLPVEAVDQSHYFGIACVESPGIDLEKSTNGEDADAVPGPEIPVGDPVEWIYLVTNTGDVPLSAVLVADDQGVVVSCPASTLDPGQSIICTAGGTAAAGQYANLGTAAATTACGSNVSDSDPSHYFGAECIESPGIDLEKSTNGEDADAVPGPEIPVGDPVEWIYLVTNTGDVPLSAVSVTDDQGVAVSCPASTLDPGQSIICTAGGTAAAGQYANLGTAAATTACGSGVADEDPSHYYGIEPPGDEGCTPGYWKNHPDSWVETGLSTGQSVESLFSEASAFPAFGSATLLGALDFGGGPGLEGAASILLRAGVAAALNASHPGVNYPYAPASVVSMVDAALASGDRDTLLLTASLLDASNNMGCPLN